MKRKPTFIAISLLFLCCGTLNKQLNKEQTKNSTKNREQKSINKNLNLQENHWVESWMDQLQYSKAIIYSDSTIIYRPESGFELNGGTLVLDQITRQQAQEEKSQTKNRNENILSESLEQEEHKEKESSMQSSKQHRSSIPLVFIGVTVVLITVAVVRKSSLLKRLP